MKKVSLTTGGETLVRTDFSCHNFTNFSDCGNGTLLLFARNCDLTRIIILIIVSHITYIYYSIASLSPHSAGSMQTLKIPEPIQINLPNYKIHKI